MTLLNLSVSPCSLGCGETFFSPHCVKKNAEAKLCALAAKAEPTAKVTAEVMRNL